MSDQPPRGFRLTEDWLAVVVGLLLFGLALAGVITPGLVP
ncbi:hypothetical protein FHS29_003480 [Saccharothrix tamanrassetensis]|uniref:Uncharacterized protein n=1 Tax=Saccharothrix tamanrassetensis TaxID=1051531 RepID=A0A841CLB3_9PSEU|nr:hypothetical protein [Saccharothrix tamanrassetensis]